MRGPPGRQVFDVWSHIFQRRHNVMLPADITGHRGVVGSNARQASPCCVLVLATAGCFTDSPMLQKNACSAGVGQSIVGVGVGPTFTVALASIGSTASPLPMKAKHRPTLIRNINPSTVVNPTCRHVSPGYPNTRIPPYGKKKGNRGYKSPFKRPTQEGIGPPIPMRHPWLHYAWGTE